MSGDRLRVVLADDDVLLREGLASLLQGSGMDVVGRAADATGLLAAVRDTVPDLAIVDIRMPPTRTTEGLEAARVIRQKHPEVAILVLSAHAEVDHAMELLATGSDCAGLPGPSRNAFPVGRAGCCPIRRSSAPRRQGQRWSVGGVRAGIRRCSGIRRPEGRATDSGRAMRTAHSSGTPRARRHRRRPHSRVACR